MKNHWIAAFVCIMATSCDSDPGTSLGSGGAGSGGNGPDASIPKGDGFPAGAISFFYRLACPIDWSAYHEAAGRVIVAANDGLPRGTLIGKPLSSGEERVHEHDFSASVTVTGLQFFAPEGGSNTAMSQPMPYTFTWKSESTAAGVPYRQLFVCKKMAQPRVDALPLPSKLHTYFELDVCPSGWKPAKGTMGRIVVGLPLGAPADVSMGGAPMTTPEPRTHTHAFSSILTTSPWGVLTTLGVGALFGQNGSYPFSGESDAATIDIPMISLLHCEKQ